MSAQHPIDRFVHLKTGDVFEATGEADRQWPIAEHMVLDLRGTCVRVDAEHLEIEVTDTNDAVGGRGLARFVREASEAGTTDDGNTVQASGKIGPLKFEFDDQCVHYEASGEVLEATADGKLDMLGPLDLRVRVTLRISKEGEDRTRLSFSAVRKNGKPLGNGEIVATPRRS